MFRPNCALAGVVVLGLSMLSGCGTFFDSICGPRYAEGGPLFPGVHMDFEMVKQGCESNQPALVALGVVDTPLSATADTVVFGCALTCLPVFLLEQAVEKMKTPQLSDARPTTATPPATPPVAEKRPYNENASP